MDRIEVLQSDFGHAFFFLPYLILGFTFLYGLLTSNIGLLYLFFGQATLVQTMTYLAHDLKTAGSTWLHGVQDLGYVAYLWTKLYLGLSMDGTVGSIVVLIIGLVTTVLSIGGVVSKWSGTGTSTILNPWYTPAPQGGAAACSSDNYTNPSTWTLHITFFFGFIFANVYALYTADAPLVDPSQKDANAVRVGNRKTIAATVGGISIIAFVLLLVFRYTMTDCDTFSIVQIPLLALSTYLGYTFFSLVAAKCGVRPVDVLGIVQGMVTVKPPTACMADVSQATPL